MSNIGSSPGIGSGPKMQVNAVRPVGTSSTGTSAVASDHAGASVAAGDAGATVVNTTALDAGGPPVDSDRVASIRKAIENGNYPIIPTKISDAIIAAGMMLRV